MSTPQSNPLRRISLGGRSMWPITAPLEGIIEPTKHLKRGDIATFINGGDQRLFFHRVTQCRADGYITRADTRHYSDGFVPTHAIIGRISRIEYRGIGVNLPASGFWSHCHRLLGISWSAVAPTLRTQWLKLKKRNR